MWTFLIAILIFLFLLILPALSSMYDQEYSEQGKRQKERERLNDETDAALATKKALNDAEDRRLATEKAKLADEKRKIEAREKANQNHLTVSQLIIYSFVFMAIAIAIILFFKNISSI